MNTWLNTCAVTPVTLRREKTPLYNCAALSVTSPGAKDRSLCNFKVIIGQTCQSVPPFPPSFPSFSVAFAI